MDIRGLVQGGSGSLSAMDRGNRGHRAKREHFIP